MEKRKEPEKSVTVSFSIPERLKSELEAECARNHTTLSSLVVQLMSRHVTYDKMMEHFGGVHVGKRIFTLMLRTLEPRTMEVLGKSLGSSRVQESFAFMNIEPNMNNLITNHFGPLAAYSGWYRMTNLVEGRDRNLILEHDLGPSWSAFLKGFYGAMIESLIGEMPSIDVEEGLVVIHY